MVQLEKVENVGINYNVYDNQERDSEKVGTNINLNTYNLYNIYQPEVAKPI
jgi:hypothetical protein